MQQKHLEGNRSSRVPLAPQSRGPVFIPRLFYSKDVSKLVEYATLLSVIICTYSSDTSLSLFKPSHCNR